MICTGLKRSLAQQSSQSPARLTRLSTSPVLLRLRRQSKTAVALQRLQLVLQRARHTLTRVACRPSFFFTGLAAWPALEPAQHEDLVIYDRSPFPPSPLLIRPLVSLFYNGPGSNTAPSPAFPSGAQRTPPKSLVSFLSVDEAILSIKMMYCSFRL